MEDKQTLQDILETVNFIKDRTATKDDLKDLRSELKGDIQEVRNEIQYLRSEIKGDIQDLRGEMQDLREEMQEGFKEVRNEIIEHVDSFVGMHKNMDTELSSVKNAVARNEEKILTMQKHPNLQ